MRRSSSISAKYGKQQFATVIMTERDNTLASEDDNSDVDENEKQGIIPGSFRKRKHEDCNSQAGERACGKTKSKKRRKETKKKKETKDDNV